GGGGTSAQLAGQLKAVDARQFHIDKSNVRYRRVFQCRQRRFRGIVGVGDKTDWRQQFLQQRAIDLVVIDDEHAAGRAVVMGGGKRRATGGLRGLGDGQVE